MCGLRRLYLLLATVITGAIGIGMIAFGNMKMNEVFFLDAFLNDHIHIGKTFIALGLLLFVIAFVGFAGLSLQSDLLLQIYAYMMLSLVIAQIVVGVVIFTRMDIIRKTLNKSLEDKFRTYDKHKAEIDKLQSVVLCCGMSGPKEWKIKELPPSCCGRKEGSCSVSSAYSSSCSQRAVRLLEGGLYLMAIICFILAFYELKCVFLACCLSNPCTLCKLCLALCRRKERPQPQSESSRAPPTSQESLLRE